MSISNEGTRVAARCANCSAIFASELKEDGTIQPVGRQGCPCGDADLRQLK